MFNLAEYRNKPQSLADFLPWAALVGESVVLNKDGSLQHRAFPRTGPRQRYASRTGRRFMSTDRAFVRARRAKSDAG